MSNNCADSRPLKEFLDGILLPRVGRRGMLVEEVGALASCFWYIRRTNSRCTLALLLLRSTSSGAIRAWLRFRLKMLQSAHGWGPDAQEGPSSIDPPLTLVAALCPLEVPGAAVRTWPEVVGPTWEDAVAGVAGRMSRHPRRREDLGDDCLSLDR